MIDQPPLISVLLPVYNGGNYLKLSVDSVLKQNLQHFELLILDDYSTDGSYEWLEGIDDERVKLFRNEGNKGLFYNLNYLVEQSRAPLIKLWAQDDIMYDFCLEEFITFHQEHPGVGFSYSARDLIDERGQVTSVFQNDDTPSVISTDLHSIIAYYTGSIAGNIANTCICKAALLKAGPFRESMKISADFDMWVRLAKFSETGFIKKSLLQLRDHSGQLSRNEQYYINHVKEDLQIYTYLNTYTNEAIRKKGRRLMRQNKLVFYYTLMVKTLLKGNWSIFKQYYTVLSDYDNMTILTWNFIKRKIFKTKRGFPHDDL